MLWKYIQSNLGEKIFDKRRYSRLADSIYLHRLDPLQILSKTRSPIYHGMFQPYCVTGYAWKAPRIINDSRLRLFRTTSKSGDLRSPDHEIIFDGK